MTTKVIAEKLPAKAKNSKFFANNFSYNSSYFKKLNNNPIIMEGFVDCEFTKHVNNDRKPVKRCLVKALYSSKHFFMKQEPKSFCWLICSGVDYKVYDPGIATIETLIEALSAEEFSCIGNLRETAINNFFTR